MRNLEVTFNILGGSVADVPQSDQFIDRAHQNCLLGHNFSRPCCHSKARTLGPKGSFRVASGSPQATLVLLLLKAQYSLSICVEDLGLARSLSQRVHMASA